MASRGAPPTCGAHVFLGNDPEANRARLQPCRDAAAAQGLPPRTLVVGGDAETLAGLLNEHSSGSLFADRRFSELVLPGLPRASSADAKLLQQLLERLPAEDLLLVSGPAPSGNRLPAWAKAAEASPGGGSAQIVWQPRPGREMQAWLREQAELRGLAPDRDAAASLLQRYEGNLAGLRMELDRLQLGGHQGELSLDHLTELEAGNDTARGVGELSRACLDGDVAKAMRALDDLQEGSQDHRMLILTVLGKNLAILSAATSGEEAGTPTGATLEKLAWRSEIPLLRKALQRTPSARWWSTLCARLAWIDGCARGRQDGNPDLELRNLAFAFAAGRPAVPRPRLQQRGG